MREGGVRHDQVKKGHLIPGAILAPPRPSSCSINRILPPSQSLPSYKDHMGHVCPAAEEGATAGRTIRFVNLAVPGVDPSFLERCRLSHVPPEADLVILELSANDDKGFNGTAASVYDVPTKK